MRDYKTRFFLGYIDTPKWHIQPTVIVEMSIYPTIECLLKTVFLSLLLLRLHKDVNNGIFSGVCLDICLDD
jgi:hypothetical protein